MRWIFENIQIIEKIYKKKLCHCIKCEKYIPQKDKNKIFIDISIQTFEIQHNGRTFYHPIDKDNHKLLYSIYATHKCLIINNDNINKNEDWEHFYKWWAYNNLPIIYTYATTIHKAQGSGFDTIIFDTDGLYYT